MLSFALFLLHAPFLLSFSLHLHLYTKVFLSSKIHPGRYAWRNALLSCGRPRKSLQQVDGDALQVRLSRTCHFLSFKQSPRHPKKLVPSVRNFKATSVKASAGHGRSQMAVVQLTKEGYIPHCPKHFESVTKQARNRLFVQQSMHLCPTKLRQ